MIRVPKLDGSGEHFHIEYDAWNRMVAVYDDDGTTLISEYQYDATGRRTVKAIDTYDGEIDVAVTIEAFHGAAAQVAAAL